MSENALQVQYRQEYVVGFERHQSLLRDCVTSEAVIKGSAAIFAVASSAGASSSATAVQRAANGRIPTRVDDVAQNTCTLNEWHDVVTITSYNIMANQGDRRALMQRTSMETLNRKIDDQIIDALETGTQDTGTATTGSLSLVVYAKTILANNNAGGGQVYAAITPAFEAYLLQTKEFTNADYRDIKPLAQTNSMISSRFGWAGIEFVVHTGLSGLATSSETCLFWNKAAVGHAADTKGLNTAIGYNEQDDYSFARASMNMGAKLLQNSGVVLVAHDGSGFAAQ